MAAKAPLPVVYLNGHYMPLMNAQVSVLDRGFLFADGVYEVMPVYGGRIFRFAEHMLRLQHSLDGIRLCNPYTNSEWSRIFHGIVDRNGGGDMSIYFQITRGADIGRDHEFPKHTAPSVFAMASVLTPLAEQVKNIGIDVMTLDDIRWQRCDVKSIDLLANVLLRQHAAENGCAEAILVRDGFAREGSSSTLFAIVDGVLTTPPKSEAILPGITRDLILELAAAHSIPYDEKPLALTALYSASEVWISSSTREVVPVVHVDGQAVGDGRPGPLWQTMYGLIQEYKQSFREAQLDDSPQKPQPVDNM